VVPGEIRAWVLAVRSGMDADKDRLLVAIKAAFQGYESDEEQENRPVIGKEKEFKRRGCWEILKKCPKWNCDFADTPPEEDDSVRPIGNKAAKRDISTESTPLPAPSVKKNRGGGSDSHALIQSAKIKADAILKSQELKLDHVKLQYQLDQDKLDMQLLNVNVETLNPLQRRLYNLKVEQAVARMAAPEILVPDVAAEHLVPDVENYSTPAMPPLASEFFGFLPDNNLEF
jgi:hypothetical protein